MAADLPEGVSSDQMQRIMRRVLEAEREKLYQITPQNINNEIEAIIEAEVD